MRAPMPRQEKIGKLNSSALQEKTENWKIMHLFRFIGAVSRAVCCLL
jgi:hypothetical protein